MYNTDDKVIAIKNLPELDIFIGDVFDVVDVTDLDGDVVIGIRDDFGVRHVADVFLKDVEAVDLEPIHDEVNNPSHYTDGGIEVIDYIEAKLTPEQFEGFLLGNVIKYTSRAGKKVVKVVDLKKAQVYLGWMVERTTRS